MKPALKSLKTRWAGSWNGIPIWRRGWRRLSFRLSIITVVCLLAIMATLIGRLPIRAQQSTTPTPAVVAPTPTVVAYIRPQVLGRTPHQNAAFTQGLLLHDGFFYESDGLYGQSKLRKVDPKTGETLQEVTLGAEYFAEGLALVDDRLIQITWREGVAFIYDVNTFNLLGQYEYEGEGWGICYDGAALYMSNGSNSLVRRDPNTFAVLQSIDVTLFGEPVFNLNELECVGDYVYANVWMQDEIMKIDKRTGVVVGYIDARRLLTAEERSKLNGQQVLNGIAYDPVQDLFYITGKQWPFVFLVRLQ